MTGEQWNQYIFKTERLNSSGGFRRGSRAWLMFQRVTNETLVSFCGRWEGWIGGEKRGDETHKYTLQHLYYPDWSGISDGCSEATRLSPPDSYLHFQLPLWTTRHRFRNKWINPDAQTFTKSQRVFTPGGLSVIIFWFLCESCESFLSLLKLFRHLFLFAVLEFMWNNFPPKFQEIKGKIRSIKD